VTEGVLGPGEALTLAFAAGGVLVLVELARRARTGHPVLPPSPDPFRPLPGGVLLSAALALLFVVQLGGFLVGLDHLGLLADLGGAALGLVAAGAGLFGVERYVLRPRGTLGRRIGSGLLLFLASFPLVWATHLAGLLLSPRKQAAVEMLEQRGPGWFGIALLAVLVAPVAEEVAFRGLLYPAIRRRLRPAGAIAVTAVLFGLVHFEAPAVWAPLAILGAFLAYLVEATGSVVPAVAAHMAFNALTVGATLLAL
jgi:membrane protease YdiL (CAAX protease family)